VTTRRLRISPSLSLPTEAVTQTFGILAVRGGSLRSLGLIEYPRPGYVVALPVCFLEEPQTVGALA